MSTDLLNFLIKVIGNSRKCQHCKWCFYGGCINAYHCISTDFSDYEEGE